MTPLLDGVGIGLRRPLHRAVLSTQRRIDWLEIVPENFMFAGGRPLHVLEQCAERWPIASHGVALSLGGPDPLDDEYLSALRARHERFNLAACTDHICWASAGGVQYHDLLPLPFRSDAAKWTAARAREAADRLGRAIALENITYYATMPGSMMPEGQFVTEVLEQADAGLLLDVNNVFVNARNHRLDPLSVLLELPLHRTRQIHLAGHVRENDVLLDTHGAPVCDEVWDLFREALLRVGRVPVLIEWDTAIPPLERVLDEADRARAILDAVAPRAAAAE